VNARCAALKLDDCVAEFDVNGPGDDANRADGWGNFGGHLEVAIASVGCAGVVSRADFYCACFDEATRSCTCLGCTSLRCTSLGCTSLRCTSLRWAFVSSANIC